MDTPSKFFFSLERKQKGHIHTVLKVATESNYTVLAVIKPLIKKPQLDPNELEHYRPI